jgi:dipeptide/tripeptide permease
MFPRQSDDVRLACTHWAPDESWALASDEVLERFAYYGRLHEIHLLVRKR